MELPVNAIVVVALITLVLVAFGAFFFQQSGGKLSEAEANRIFYDTCSEFKRDGCDWSRTYDEKFTKYMEACSVVFGNEAGKYSCLYRFCCKETENVLCSGFCHACSGNEAGKASTESCCSRFRAECGNAECGVCA